MVRMGACRVPDRGSIPRRGDFLPHVSVSDELFSRFRCFLPAAAQSNTAISAVPQQRTPFIASRARVDLLYNYPQLVPLLISATNSPNTKQPSVPKAKIKPTSQQCLLQFTAISPEISMTY